MNRKIFLLLLSVIIALPLYSHTFGSKGDEKELLQLSEQKWQWLADKDVVHLDSLFHSEAQFVHMGGYWGKQQELEVIRTGRIWYKQADVHQTEVKLLNHIAFVYSSIHLTAEVGGNLVRNPFIVTEAYCRENGKWKLASMIFTKTLGE